MARPRAFDYDRARELRTQGWTYKRIAQEFGVSVNAVNRACDPGYRARQAALVAARLEALKAECLGGCGRMVWTHNADSSGYCTACAAALRIADNIRPDALRCTRCGAWKPDGEFADARSKPARARRGKRPECRSCETARRRANRAANREREREYQRQRYLQRKAVA